MAALSELHERLLRIANRAGVSERLMIEAVLGEACINAEDLPGEGEEGFAQVFDVARRWDDDESDVGDPNAETLRQAAEKWAHRRGTE